RGPGAGRPGGAGRPQGSRPRLPAARRRRAPRGREEALRGRGEDRAADEDPEEPGREAPRQVAKNDFGEPGAGATGGPRFRSRPRLSEKPGGHPRTTLKGSWGAAWRA